MKANADELILELFSHEKTKEKAFKLLMDNYQKDMYRTVRRIVITHEDANDVVQNALLKIWLNLDRYRLEASLFSWIAKICTNEALNYIEKNRKPNVSIDDESITLHLKEETVEKTLSSEQIQNILQQAILNLPKKQQIVFSLRYYEEMPYEQMSKLLNTSESSLKTSYHFAHKKVEEFVAKQIL
ncbi:MAG: sigma-70 family RNA polymerase sigma factor [Bacteroidales bacterium]|jgi:RNA polymerase sigma-70 factor (ECF subfamily)|nr:sigma-70 family RNA polymerase sigma factor [Bacteroidales bacterium]